MKSAQHTNKFKSKLMSLAVCATFIICAALSFLFVNVGGVPKAAGETGEHGVRFVQVAAGQDFAIGLTYDGDLYGWSLLDGRSGATSVNTGATTLGGYYTSVPTKIDVTFRYGPGTGNTVMPWNNGVVSGHRYHDELPAGSDRIVQIATTRYTAAFLTANGYIYTWGKPISDVSYNQNKEYNSLLLRTEEVSFGGGHFYTPYIINYESYFSVSGSSGSSTHTETANHALQLMRPTGTSGFSDASLAGGEYNYIFVYARGSAYYTYVWGSLMYAATNLEPKGTPYLMSGTTQNSLCNDDSEQRLAYKTAYAKGESSKITAIAGGHTVGFNLSDDLEIGTNAGNASSLALRGKNFITSLNFTKGSTTTNAEGKTTTVLDVTKTVETTDGFSDILFPYDGVDYKAENGIVGASGNAGKVTGESADGVNGQISFKVTGSADSQVDTNLQYYGRVAGGYTFLGSSNRSILGANGMDITTDNNVDAKAILNGVSLGNDVGYAIVGGASNVLYAWGDNAEGQLGGGDGDTRTHISTPTQVTIRNMSNPVSVAAGRQLSAKDVPFNSASTFKDSNIDAFNPLTANEAAYITGVLDSSGDLYVWSNTLNAPTPVEYAGKRGQFAAVYSGYGNYLFAITKQGKLVQISVKENQNDVKLHDTFGTVDANGVVSTVNSDWTKNDGNSVTFATVDQDVEYGSVIIYADAVETVTEGKSPVTYKGASLIKTNPSGDSYRILDWNDGTGDADIEYLKSTTLNLTVPRFEFNGKVMTSAQIKNMFSYEVVYGTKNVGTDDNPKAAGTVGIKITPKQSTKGKPVKVSFYVARYDNASEFETSANADNGYIRGDDNAVYYDYKECSVEFIADNTEAVMQFSPFGDGAVKDDGAGNSNIPLLDPNNKYNKVYTLAVQDVSGGIGALSDYLFKNNDVIDPAAGTLKTNINDYIEKNEPGFPAKSKVAAGHLDYYLGSAAESVYYTGSYQYLFKDRDTDLIKFNNVTGTSAGSAIERSPVTSFDVSVTLDRTAVAAIGGKLDVGANGVRPIDTDFNNTYGIYNIKLGAADDDGNRTLSFTYDILRFTAKDSTGMIAYDGEDSDFTPSDYITTKTEAANSYPYLLNTSEFSGITESFAPDTGATADARPWSESLHVFAQATLRVESLKVGGALTAVDLYGNKDEGKAEPENKYTGNRYTVYYTDDYGSEFGPAAIGNEINIPLKSFVPVTSNIAFSFNNVANSTSEYKKFDDQFSDETGSGETVVHLTASNITIRPTTQADITFTVALQRFYGAQTFGKGESRDEKIYITFVINRIGGFNFNTITSGSNAKLDYDVSQASFIDVFGGAGALNSGYPLIVLSESCRAKLKLTGLQSSDANVLAVSKTSETTVSLAPNASGSVVVQFILTVYGRSEIVRLQFDVSGVTTVNDDISLIDTHYQYLNILLNKLRKSNSFVAGIEDYSILPDDVENAYYFTDAEGNRLEAAPKFVRSVRFIDLGRSNPMVRVEANSEELENSSDTYYLHLRYGRISDSVAEKTYAEMTEKNIPVLETRQKISSSKKIVPGDPNYLNPYFGIVDSIYTLWIDVDNVDDKHKSSTDASDWYVVGENTDAVVHVRVQYLLELVKTQNPDQYDIFRVSASSSDAQYFNYDYNANNEIIITPISNTPKSQADQKGNDPLTITVAVKPKSTTSENSNIILAFRVSIDGISTTLPKETYVTIWLVAFFSSFGVLLIIFIIRLIIYWKRRSKQRALIKRNQELIKMRDRIHNKATAATREQVVRTKLKMEDPKYAKMFNDMRKDKENESGITLENSELAAMADDKSKKKKKKKGGKKSIAELKAELEAKKAAIAQAQSATPVNPFGDGGADSGMGGMGGMDGAFGAPDVGFGEPAFTPEATFAPDMDGDAIVFDAPDNGDGML